MRIEHTPEDAFTSSVTTYSCLIDSRSKLPIMSFRHFGPLYDLSGGRINPDYYLRKYVPLFALEDNYKQIRSDGAYDYTALSGDNTRRYRGNTNQIVEEGVYYSSGAYTNAEGTLYQPYGYSLTFGTALNQALHEDTVEQWIKRAMLGELYKPYPSSRFEIVGGIIPDGIAERVTMPLSIQDYMKDNEDNKWGHTIWSLGRPHAAGLYTFHPGNYNAPALDTFVGLPQSGLLNVLSTQWIYPEGKHYNYAGYLLSEMSFAQGVRVDFRSTHGEALISKNGLGVTFDGRFKGWYDPLYEVSVGTPRSIISFTLRHDESRQ